MKRLSIFVVLASLIIACQNTGSNSEGPNFIQIGHWSVNTDSMVGILTGRQSKSKIVTTTQSDGDTVLIADPIDRHISIKKHYEGNAFLMSYIDSTINVDSLTSFYGLEEFLLVDTPFGSDDNIKQHTLWSDWWVRIGVKIPFDCDSTYNLTDEIIKVNLRKDENNLLRTYLFDANGMLEASRYIVCES